MPTPQDLRIFLETQYNFRGCTPEEKDALAQAAQVRKLKPDQPLFSEGDPVEGLWFLLEGALRIHCSRTNDTFKLWGTIPGPNLICGYEIFRWDHRHSESAIAQTEGWAALIPLAKIQNLMACRPGIATGMADYLAFIIDERRQDVRCVTAEDKLRLYFQRQVTYMKRFVQSPEGLKIHRDHFYEQIAEMTGLTRETVNRWLKEKAAEGLIRLEKKFILWLDERIFDL